MRLYAWGSPLKLVYIVTTICRFNNALAAAQDSLKSPSFYIGHSEINFSTAVFSILIVRIGIRDANSTAIFIPQGFSESRDSGHRGFRASVKKEVEYHKTCFFGSSGNNGGDLREQGVLNSIPLWNRGVKKWPDLWERGPHGIPNWN